LDIEKQSSVENRKERCTRTIITGRPIAGENTSILSSTE